MTYNKYSQYNDPLDQPIIVQENSEISEEEPFARTLRELRREREEREALQRSKELEPTPVVEEPYLSEYKPVPTGESAEKLEELMQKSDEKLRKKLEKSKEMLHRLSPEERKDLLTRIDNLQKQYKLRKHFSTEQPESEQPERHKKAYPNYEDYKYVHSTHDVQKWMQAIKDIYYNENNGLDRSGALKKVTAGWKEPEVYDFLNWLKFYEEGSHLKYKFAQAQTWYENGSPGYFLPVKKDPELIVSSVTSSDFNEAKDHKVEGLSAKEKKQIVEKQRSKIISRLDSAEKLLRSEQGELFAGKELESLMETIYQLKKKIQLVNKISTSTRLYDDMIVREANILVKKGFSDAAEMLYTLAQTPAQSAESATSTPGSSTVPSSSTDGELAKGQGSAGGLPAAVPAKAEGPESTPNDNSPVSAVTTPSAAPAPAPAPLPEEPLPEEPLPASITSPGQVTAPAAVQFLQNLEGDLQVVDDSLEVSDEELVVQAQDVTTTAPVPAAAPAVAPPAVSAPIKEEPVLEVEEDTSKNQAVGAFDKKIDDVFSSITIPDVIAKLEQLSLIFKTREIPRQLAIVDMMLDSLGLAAYFPALSEATNKSLESNNYIATRIDDVLSKLHGAIKGKDIDLIGKEEVKVSPQVEEIKENLEKKDEAEKARKELRKEQELQEAQSTLKETPEIEIEEEPTPAPAATPAAPAPAAPTPAPTPTPAPAPAI